MHRKNSQPRSSRRLTDGWSGAGWVARWVLVLVLAFDFVSAPFHHHHHDGVQTQPGVSAAHASLDEGGSHADDADPGSASHSAMAIRVDPSRAAQLPSIDRAQPQMALIAVAQRLPSLGEPPPTRWRPDRSPPDFHSHRSLPPAGRAPPLHA